MLYDLPDAVLTTLPFVIEFRCRFQMAILDVGTDIINQMLKTVAQLQAWNVLHIDNPLSAVWLITFIILSLTLDLI